MKNISFALTERQLLDGTKTVTRRLGWRTLKAGDHLCAVRKAMGLRPGEKIARLCEIEVLSVRRERLWQITVDDVAREGFPELTPKAFVEFFCEHMGGRSTQLVTRIEFRRVVP